ncbi:MAG: hemerythrin domain-containing protein [Candidatus Zixiibacteriota bacterium]
MAELCQSLRAEHQLIQRVLNAMATEAIRVDNGNPLNGIFVLCALKFLREFADGVHFQKEETVLFVRLEQMGVPRGGGPIGIMLDEHAQVREMVAAIELKLEPAMHGDGEAAHALVQTIRDSVVLWRAHIEREDHLLFPMAEQLLGDRQKAEMLALFGEMESCGTAASQRQVAWAESFG